jgi:hypothetical protein
MIALKLAFSNLAAPDWSLGILQWGAGLYGGLNWGNLWKVTIYVVRPGRVNPVVGDRKFQGYSPHGSLPARRVPSGSYVYLAGTVTLSDGLQAGVSGDCVMP